MIPLFLDFDGVLHPEHCRETEHFTRVPVLQDLLEAEPGLAVVVSSTWRLTRDAAEILRGHLVPALRDRVIGQTPVFKDLQEIPEEHYAYQREAECRAWLSENALVGAAWIAIDDRSWNFRPFGKNLVLVNGRIGLQAADIARVMDKRRSLLR